MKVLYSKKNGITNKLSGVNLPVDADKIDYDNTESELQSTNVQDAIDEINSGKVDKVTGKDLSTNDYDNTDKAKVGKIDETTTSISGNPISISGLKSNQLAKDPIITLEPIQAGSGDPSPSNIRAISGYDKIEVLSCGKNLVETVESGYYDENTGEKGSSDNYCRTSKFNVICGQKYSLSVGVWGSPVNNIYYWKDDTYLGKDDISITPGVFTYTFMIREDANICAISCGGSNYPITPERWGNVMIEYGEIPTIYEPYNPITNIQLTLGQTIYGGTLDVEKGVLTVDRGYRIINGTEDMSFTGYSIAVKLNTTDIDVNNVGQTILNDGVYGSNNSAIYTAQEYDWEFYTTPYSCYSLDAFKTYVQNSNIQLVYPLATPFTIQLTPHEISLLKDYAYVSTNGTNMSLDYHNGEIASLGDVAQLGQTVNELRELMENKIGYTKIQNSITITSTSYTVVNDGFLFGMITSTSGQVQYITINDIQVIGVANNSIPVVFSVKAGDVIKTREGSAFTYLLFIAEFGR